MIKKLKDIAATKSGLVLNRKKASLQSEFKEHYKVISLKSFNKTSIYDGSFADDFESSEVIKDENLIKKGDVLVRLREPIIASYIDKEYEETIISSLTAVIRINDKNINPFYLAMYLNSKDAQNQLSLCISQTHIPMIKIRDLDELNIKIPSIEKQNKLIELHQLHIKEMALFQNLITEKEKLNQEVFETIIKEDK